MANGLVVADTGISVGGRAVLGANLGRVQVGMVTHTSDTALATQAAGGSQMGSAVSMTVPSAGVIRVSISAACHWPENWLRRHQVGNIRYFKRRCSIWSEYFHKLVRCESDDGHW